MDGLSNQEKLGVREILDTEVGRTISIIMVIFGFAKFMIMPIYDIKMEIETIRKDIDIINTNHLTHIEGFIKDINDRNNKQDEKIDNMCLKLEKFLGKYGY